jgi:hypothetical protein
MKTILSCAVAVLTLPLALFAASADALAEPGLVVIAAAAPTLLSPTSMVEGFRRTLALGAASVMDMLTEAGRFAEPSGDLLTAIQGLSSDDIEYVVQNTNPYEQIAPNGLLGGILFPDRRTQDLQFGYLKGAGGGAVMAHVGAHTGEAPLVGRKGVETVRGEIPSIRQKRLQDAQTLIRLQSADPLVRSAAVQEIYDDVTGVRLGVAARLEKMRMDALATGVASQITDENLVFTVDYGVPAGHQETLAGPDLWTDPASTPLDDIEGWQNTLVADTGRRATRAVTSTAVINALRSHESIRRAIYGVNYERRITTADLNAFLAEQDLPTLIAYDILVQVKAANGTFSSLRLWPSNRITLIPDISAGPLGRTLRAPTAEEGLAGSGVAEGVISVDGDRTAVHVYTATQDPKGIVTLGVGSQFPSFEGADGVFQAQVLA